MSCVAFPLRLERGFLRKFDEASALLALIEIIARTPHGSWSGGSHFGLRDYLDSRAHRSEVPKAALDELNKTLQDLGLGKWKIESIVPEASAGNSSAVFNVTVSLDECGTQVFRIERGP